jgi:flagellar hook assembly protein FlgD
VSTIANGQFTAGWHSLIWNGKDSYGKKVSSGVYIYQLSTPEMTLTRKMMLMK